jgi:hypothetical protein
MQLLISQHKTCLVIFSLKYLNSLYNKSYFNPMVSVLLDYAAIIDRGVLYVPLRQVAETLGAKVNWDAATQTVTVTE